MGKKKEPILDIWIFLVNLVGFWYASWFFNSSYYGENFGVFAFYPIIPILSTLFLIHSLKYKNLNTKIRMGFLDLLPIPVSLIYGCLL